MGLIVVSREQVFDAINEWHQGHVHMGQERLWTYCRSKYFNVTQTLVKIYCETCIACSKKNPVGNAQKGSTKPIMSLNWRSRFELDLMDFCKLRKRDPFGVLMHWILTLKDHATALVYLYALPRKWTNLIAYKLQEIFGIVGCPKIFHTDNGKEFTTKVVLEFLQDLNPNILMVTGRPRGQSDQVSVENMNKFVKRTLGTVLAEYRLVGKHPNRTEVLGSIMSAINTQHGQGKNDVSAYEAMYGQKWTMNSHVQRRKRANAGQYQNSLRVTNDPEFTEYVRENYIIDDKEICDDDAEGYFSDGLLPVDKKKEVSDEYFFDHLKDDISKEDHGEGEGYHTFNKFNAESDNHSVDPVHDVVAESSIVGPEQSITMRLSKKQVVEKTSSDVPMSLKNSPPEKMIDQSTAQKILFTEPKTKLTTMLVASSDKEAVDLQLSSEEESKEQKILSKQQKTTTTLEALSDKEAVDLQSSSSEESEDDSQFTVKYEEMIRSRGHALCNWQFKKCYLSNRPEMHCQFKDRCSNFAHKRCSILWSRTHGCHAHGNNFSGYGG